MQRVIVCLALAVLAVAQPYQRAALVSTSTPTLSVTATVGTTTPSVTGFTCTPGTIDNTALAASRAVTCTVTVSNVVGVSYQFSGPLGYGTNVLAESMNGNCFTVGGTLTCTPSTVPALAATGTWNLVYLAAWDNFGNKIVATSSFPTSFTVTGTTDTTAPELVGLTISPTTLTVTGTGTAPSITYRHPTFTYTVNATDADSGFASAIWFVRPPAGSTSSKLEVVNVDAASVVTGLASITQSTITGLASPVKWVTGDWVVVRVILVDRTGNYRVYEGASLSAAAPGGLTISVTQATAPTTTFIRPIGFVMAPTTINIAGAATAAVRYNVTLEGTFPAGTIRTVEIFLSHNSLRYEFIERSLSFADVQGGNTVYTLLATYSDLQLKNGQYTLAAIRTEDSFRAKLIQGNCPTEEPEFGYSFPNEDTCANPNVDRSSAFTVGASSAIVILAAVLASLFMA